MPRAALFLGIVSSLLLSPIAVASSETLAGPPAVSPILSMSPASSCHEMRGTISIASASDFTASNGVRRGSGTQSDPFVIECWTVAWDPNGTESTSLYIGQTTQHVLLRQIEFAGTGASRCVFLNGTANVRMEQLRPADCPDEMVRIDGAAQVSLANSTIDATGNTKNPLRVLNSGNVRVTGNDITRGQLASIELCGNLGAEVAWNNVSFGAGDAVVTCGGSGELVHHNRFIHNNRNQTPQAWDVGDNRWDDGVQGNWWSDLTGPDEDRDGIVDVAYGLGPGTQRDRYPLCPDVGCWWSGGMLVSISANRTQGPAPLDVGFASNVSGGRPPYIFAWDFGDGSASSAPAPAHRFPLPGAHLVELTIEDSQGNQSIAGPLMITAMETAPPKVVSSSPAEAARDVPVDSGLRLEFSSEMERFSTEGAVTISPSHPLGLTWSPDSRTLDLDPSGNLGANTTFVLSVGTAARSVGGLAFESEFRLGFTTAVAATPDSPRVVRSYPEDGASGVPVNLNITLEFSLPMDRATTESALTVEPPINRSVRWAADSRILAIDTAGDLATETGHVLRLSRDARSATGARLDTEFTLTFSTGGAADLLPPSISHVPPLRLIQDRGALLTFRISDPSGIGGIVLHYRPPEGSYAPVEVYWRAGDEFAALLPTASVRPPRVEYYIEAEDVIGNRGTAPVEGAAGPFQALVAPEEPAPASTREQSLPRDFATFVSVAVAALVSAVVWAQDPARRKRRSGARPGGVPRDRRMEKGTAKPAKSSRGK